MLEVTTRGKYGLILMAVLAKQKGVLSLREIASSNKLPFYYLVRLAGQLRNHGLIVSVRGRRGGYRLAREPDQLTIKEILEVLEGPMAPTPCLQGKHCQSKSFCLPQRFWRDLSGEVNKFLSQYMLQDLIDG